MIDDFMVRALAAGIGVALVAAPLGCFVVWRRMAYFGATLAHSALLGVALGLMLNLDLTLGVVVSSVAVTLLVALFQRQSIIGSDTLLGILAHSGLALGLVALSFLHGVRVDLMTYLFGDVLAVSTAEIAWIYGGGVLVLGTLALIWRPLLSLTIHEELARAEGVPALRVQIAFMLTLAVAVAIAMKVVGVLLIISLLIIPAAAARGVSRTPEQMAVLASIVGIVSVIGGLFASLRWDTPSGPSIVVAATVLFALGLSLAAVRRAKT
ncbi:MAG TPA: metal ABC transporter permease [Kiloniellales bacterium]|jgi:zinc transport system permease protein